MVMRILGCFAWITGGVRLCMEDIISHGMDLALRNSLYLVAS